MTDRDKDTDWFFDWPSGYVRYRNGKREVWQDSFSKPSPMANAGRLTDLERASIMRAIETLEGVENIEAFATDNDATAAATLRGLLERLGGGE